MTIQESASNASPQDRSLDSQADRQRMSGPGLRTFFGCAAEWNLSIDQQRILLGDIARSTLHKWKKEASPVLTRDQLERISLVLGIYKAMKLLFTDAEAGRQWFVAPNRDWAFGGGSPIARMLGGSIDDLYSVRRYLDSWRGVR